MRDLRPDELQHIHGGDGGHKDARKDSTKKYARKDSTKKHARKDSTKRRDHSYRA